MSELNRSTRDLANDWLRMLTVMEDDDMPPQEKADLILKVNPPFGFHAALDAPPEQVAALNEGLAELDRMRARQEKMHLLLEDLMLMWIAQVTGMEKPDIIRRLALELNATLTADGPEDGDGPSRTRDFS